MKDSTIAKNQLLDVKSMVLCSMFAALCAVGAFIQIPLPNLDYFTLQYLFVMLTAMLLGSKRGLISLSIYVLTGLVGFPVFAAGGGITYLLKPTFGYLLGFIVAAYITGYLVEKNNADNFLKYFMAGLAGFIVIYFIGFSYKYFILNFYLGIETPFYLIFWGAFPLDMPGDFLATILASIFAIKIKKAVKL
ncbi:MAG: biotin transporter BioY [Peptostreptococcus sp.]|uniref:biotin transporter BioY n=1 Tax=Peptostreptococcus sp. TaxID=1262 RepID=UPI002FC8D63A